LLQQVFFLFKNYPMSRDEFADDVYGKALYDYYQHGQAEALILHTSYGLKENMPVEWFFRDEEDFPELERIALGKVRGTTLDIGAGVGSHALNLYQRGINVCVMDNAWHCAKIMEQRGLPNVLHQSVWHPVYQRYDTILMLMNGIGLVGDISGLKRFLDLAKGMLKPGGQILFDSSDLSYLYPDKNIYQHPDLGIIRYQYKYRGMAGEPFLWLYIDFATLTYIASDKGWKARLLYEDPYAQYLASLSLY